MTQDELLVLIYKKDEKVTHYPWYVFKSLFSVINVLVRNREEAEDVLQDVFVKNEKHWLIWE
jgi:RNA polymerase sigma-70 factor (ECF subfamily)